MDWVKTLAGMFFWLIYVPTYVYVWMDVPALIPLSNF